MDCKSCQEYEDNFILFRKLFEEGFSKPSLKTDKFIGLWYNVDLLMVREALSGPFYNVATYYNCDYVFEGKREYFKEINTCEDFLNWCLNIIKRYKNKINLTNASDCIEEQDKGTLLVQAETMKKLSYMVYDIQKDRWELIKSTASI